MIRSALIFSMLIGLWLPLPSLAEGQTNDQDLIRVVKSFAQVLSGQSKHYSLRADIELKLDDRLHQVALQLSRLDDQSFDLEIRHQDYWLVLLRREDQTAMVLPLHKTAFVGRGALSGRDVLAPLGMTKRLVSLDSAASMYLRMFTAADSTIALSILNNLFPLKQDADGNYAIGDDGLLSLVDGKSAFRLTLKNASVSAELDDSIQERNLDAELDGMKLVELDRSDLERCLVRGVRRAGEVLAPLDTLKSPAQVPRTVQHGSLQWISGQRVVSLWGTPEEIGRAHGQLLKQEAERCLDSVIHMFAVAQTINRGRWFPDDLQQAYRQLSPHIPGDHKRETIALADAIGWDRELLQIVNVFPELFHCSGFAVFGSATVDGKLYHGRVLDYMTTIGLQDSATIFIVAVDNKIPFANVGYAGFIGSVSGMNGRSISLGEMGGRGEGKWDGVPMATLMRRALEECDTLDEVKSLWSSSPRTCEYFYVFADGKTNDAVGVAATPDAIEFIQPGQADQRLGTGIADAVVLSAGERLATLRSRVQQRHGQIDVDVAKWLMSRPVAMESNLHNVLFVPADGVMYVANASHDRPAAEQPYVEIDLRQLLLNATHSTDQVTVTQGAE